MMMGELSLTEGSFSLRAPVAAKERDGPGTSSEARAVIAAQGESDTRLSIIGPSRAEGDVTVPDRFGGGQTCWLDRGGAW